MDEGFGIRVDYGPQRATLVVSGDLDLRTADDLVASVCGSVDAGLPTIEVDLAGVTFFGSDGVRSLILGRDYAAAAGAELVVLRPSVVVDKVLELVGLRTAFTIRD